MRITIDQICKTALVVAAGFICVSQKCAALTPPRPGPGPKVMVSRTNGVATSFWSPISFAKAPQRACKTAHSYDQNFFDFEGVAQTSLGVENWPQQNPVSASIRFIDGSSVEPKDCQKSLPLAAILRFQEGRAQREITFQGVVELVSGTAMSDGGMYAGRLTQVGTGDKLYYLDILELPVRDSKHNFSGGGNNGGGGSNGGGGNNGGWGGGNNGGWGGR